jgi:hypothetical protein
MNGSLKRCVLAGCVALSSCAMPIDDATDLAVVMPSRSTSSAEIAGAIQELIKTDPICARIPGLRLVGRPVDFDRVEGAQEDLDLLVDLGYLTKTAAPDRGKRGFKYERTERGQDTHILGASGFCLPAERVLVSVTHVERKRNAPGYLGPDGYLIVDFTHTLDPNSIWAHEPALAKLMAGNQAVLLPGPLEGRALLSRVWLRSEHPLKGAPHSGALWAVSYDPVHNRWEGGRWGALTLKVWRPE